MFNKWTHQIDEKWCTYNGDKFKKQIVRFFRKKYSFYHSLNCYNYMYTTVKSNGKVAQWIMHQTWDLGIAASSPVKVKIESFVAYEQT